MAYLEPPPIDARTNAVNHATLEGHGAAFRLAMREFASGVALISAVHGDKKSGCTATSLCSLSLEPPSLIVCIERGSATLAVIGSASAFGVSIVGAEHEALADRFAGRTGLKGAARFAGADWMTLATGAPLLTDALASMDCRVEEILERHTHAIVIGRILAVRRNADGPALLHWRGRFQPLG
jgi:flavin reductase (DIM6/NTAB) family NADH-FMN oxidoreductase RutF